VSRFQNNKSVHISMSKGIHAQFRIALFERGLSMQEVFERLAAEVVYGNTQLNKILDELEYNKKHKIKTKKVTQADAESVFEAIADVSPLDG